MATVTFIPARPRANNGTSTEKVQKIRVAAYCRVSTETEEQATSYETQVEHYTEYIKKNPLWECAGIYTDDGISGTNTKKRDGFNKLIADCMDGKIDMVVTKSISRFARNTLDCLKYIRQLKEKNIAVIFEKENINTLDAKGEVLITIMASLAQQESQSLSQNVKLGLQYRYQQGKVQICTNRFLGYDKGEDGGLVVNREEAEVVKRIYREYLEGGSYYQIGQSLERDGIKTAAGSVHWLPSTLAKILKNEKYIGDALLQKTVTVDFLTKKRVVNRGIAPQYYVEGSHEAIIPKDLFLRVQEEMVRRTHLQTDTGKKRIYSGRYALSSRVYCGHCGDLFQRTHWKVRGEKVIVWRCVTRLHKKDSDIECNARTITEELLHEVVVKAINQVAAEEDTFIPSLKKAVARAMGTETREKVAKIDEKLVELQKEVLKRANARRAYDSITEQIESLREEKHQILLKEANDEAAKQKVAELEAFIDGMNGDIKEYEDAYVQRLIEKITVYDDYFKVEFKSGLETTIQG